MEDRTSRYIKMKKLKDYEGVDCQETFIMKDIEEKDTDTYYNVQPEEENRLDLVSMKFYSNPLLWWVIAIASNIKDPFTIPVGTTLRIPAPETVYSVRGIV